MSDIHVEVILKNVSGLAKDEFVTSFNYTCGSVDSTGVTPLVDAFYNTAGTGQTNALVHYLGGQVDYSTNSAMVRYYDKTGHLDGSPSGGPFQVDEFTLTNAAANSQPNQLCAVSSFYDALDAAGTTTGRNRGRMFFGPLSSNAFTGTSAGNNPALSPTFQVDLAAATQDLAVAMFALTTSKLFSVWSRKNSVMTQAVGGWVANEIATQRRRARAATTRSTYLI